MSYIEENFAKKLIKYNFPDFKREFRFHPSRKWRFDFAWPEYKLATEVEGGIWLKGKRQSRHTNPKGFTADIVKYSEAMCLGWTVLRVTPDQVKSNQAFDWLYRLMELKENE